jgi:hypothetical protein
MVPSNGGLSEASSHCNRGVANFARRLLEIAGPCARGRAQGESRGHDRALLLLSEAVRLEDGLRRVEGLPLLVVLDEAGLLLHPFLA